MLSISDILIKGLSLFVACYVLHLIIWRVHRPVAYPLWLPTLFFLLPLVGMGVLLVMDWGGPGGGSSDLLLVQLLAIFLLHASLSSAYIVFYSGLIAFSPSLAILEAIERSMPLGLNHGELFLPWFNHENLLGHRLQNLMAARMLAESEGAFHLTARGRLVARGFRLYRRSIGLAEIGEG